VKSLEDELRLLEKQYGQVKAENDALKHIQHEQSKALEFLQNEDEYDRKLREVKSQLVEAKNENKRLTAEYMEKERINKKAHEKIIRMEERCLALQTRIKNKKEEMARSSNGTEGKIEEEITEEAIEKMDAQIKELDKEQEELNKQFDANLKNLNREKNELELQQLKLQAVLKEKDKELRLFTLRMKEIKKLVRFTALKPLQSSNFPLFSHLTNRLS
jgi:chromosome segregation ATPase